VERLDGETSCIHAYLFFCFEFLGLGSAILGAALGMANERLALYLPELDTKQNEASVVDRFAPCGAPDPMHMIHSSFVSHSHNMI